MTTTLSLVVDSACACPKWEYNVLTVPPPMEMAGKSILNDIATGRRSVEHVCEQVQTLFAIANKGYSQ